MSIKSLYDTVTGLEADAWRDEAVLVLQREETWQEIIKPEDVQRINFEQHAASEHKERLPSELAQIVLAREGFGTVSRKKIAEFF